MQIQNRERAWSRGRKCFELLRIPMTSSLLLTFKSNWITWMSNEHCAALCAPTAAISQLFLSKLLRSRRRRVSLIRVLCLRPGAFLDRLPRESQSLVVALGGIQFCKLLALSKLENCTALAEALLSRSVYCAHKGLLVAYTPCRQKPQKVLTKARNRPGGTTEKDKSVAMQFGSASAGNKRKYHESRKTSFEWIIFAGLVQLGCCQANSSCFSGGNGENCPKSNWFSHTSPENREF